MNNSGWSYNWPYCTENCHIAKTISHTICFTKCLSRQARTGHFVYNKLLIVQPIAQPIIGYMVGQMGLYDQLYNNHQ